MRYLIVVAAVAAIAFAVVAFKTDDDTDGLPADGYKRAWSR